MSFTAEGAVPWTFPPDWTQPVRETLAWLTDVERSRTGVQQKSELRQAPRRGFSFNVKDDAQYRRVAEMLRFERGAKPWLLPIWHDAQLLAAPLAEGAESIDCATIGYDFAPGANVLLWRSPLEFEVVVVGAVDVDGLTLGAATLAAWAAGTRLYPLRSAVLAAPVDEAFLSDDVSSSSVQFQVDEPCDWPAALPASSYRDSPLLDQRPCEPQDWKAGWTRQLLQTDEQTGPITTLDLPARSFRAQQTYWQIAGRADNTSFRSLLYGLRGRMGALWLPSWTRDLILAAAAAAIDTTISIQWCGYVQFADLQPGKRDIRIELFGGVVICRRIIDCEEAGATETLTLDAALGVAFTPSAVRRIAFMASSQLRSDAIELTHTTDADGLTECTLEWDAANEL